MSPKEAKDGEPRAKRRKVVKASTDRISLDLYGAGREWEHINSERADGAVAIHNQLFLFPQHLADNRGKVIQASNDYGQTWYDYSELPHPIIGSNILPVYSPLGTVVYVIGGLRSYASNLNEWDSKQRFVSKHTTEIWRSRDFMKTFELVTDKSEFGHNTFLSSAADDDGTLYVLVSQSSTYTAGLWKSNDMGVTWQRSRESLYALAAMKNHQACIAHRNRLYGVTFRGGLSKRLVYGENSGETWREIKPDFTPQFIIKDVKGDRVICFTSNDIYVLAGDSTEWTRLPNDWRKKTKPFEPQHSKGYMPTAAYSFDNGTVLLRVELPGERINWFISHAEKARLVNAKVTLSMYLGRKGIDAVLFKETIAPFLFPF